MTTTDKKPLAYRVAYNAASKATRKVVYTLVRPFYSVFERLEARHYQINLDDPDIESDTHARMMATMLATAQIWTLVGWAFGLFVAIVIALFASIGLSPTSAMVVGLSASTGFVVFCYLDTIVEARKGRT